MKFAKECKDRFEDIVAFVMGELDSPAAQELQVHIAVCGTCRAVRDALVEEEKEVRLGFEALARGLGPVEQSMIEEEHRQPAVRIGAPDNHFLERMKTMILTHKRLSAAAATVAALAASLILYVILFSSTTVAYALEQTAQANNHITSYHVKITPPVAEGRAKGVSEVWVQLNPDRTALMRVDRVDKDPENDRVTFGSKDKTEFWFRAKNLHIICTNKDLNKKGFDEFMASRAFFDPKLAFEQLQADKKAGKVQVATKEPAKEGEPITLTVTSNDKPDRRQVYDVDPKSKLVLRVIEYQRRGDQWKQVSNRDYLDYNKEIDPKIFQPELPKDVIVIDQTHIDYGNLGLPRGDLTDDEIATKVAKEFTEALIAGDYQKANRLSYGIPGDGFKRLFEQHKIKLLRIVEIGKPTTFHDPRFPDKRRRVSVKVEMEEEGKRTVKENSFGVGPVPNHTDRWSIDSGF